MHRAEPFWDFSLRVYGREGVPAACLWLQDELDVDVNLLLYGCWLGSACKVFDDKALGRALAFSSIWAAEVVHPLRRARRWLKQDTGSDAGVPGEVDRETRLALREQVKAVELAAEKLQQLTLEQIDVPTSRLDRIEAIATNLRRYFNAAGIHPDDAAADRLEVLLGAVLPDADEKKLRACARSLGGLPRK